MKLQTVAAGLLPVLPLLRCPLCGDALALSDGQSLRCTHRHTFDLTTKGYVNFAPNHDQQADKYDALLFESRARIFADGFYTHVIEALADALQRYYPLPECGFPAPSIEKPIVNAALPQLCQPVEAQQTKALPLPARPLLADIGCGEGYYTRMLRQRPPYPTCIGVDLSRAAIAAAAKQAPAQPWLVGDLTHLPLADASVDVLLDVLTPADYQEFARVLKPGGLLLKVVPEEDYLCEIRNAMQDKLQSGPFSNARVIEHLQEHAQVLERIAMRRTLPLTDTQAQDFLRMTPMTFGLAQDVRTGVTLHAITVSLTLLVCRMPQA